MGENENKPITVDEIISSFVQHNSDKTDGRLIEGLKKTLYEDIRNEIVEKEIESISNNAMEKFENDKKQKRLLDIKVIIVETLLIGFFSGLVVNQVTELISMWKGYTKDEQILSLQSHTWYCIIGLGLILILLIFAMYLDKVSDLIYKRKKDK